MTYERKIREGGLVQGEKAHGNLISAYEILTGGSKEERTRPFSVLATERKKRQWAEIKMQEILFLHQRKTRLEQRGSRVSILGKSKTH